GVRVCGSIDEAITLGTDRVQVAGVLSIAEHGDYPVTELTGQKMYPRRRFFDEAGSSVPLAWRFPQLDLPQGCEIESALTVGYGPLEDYGFHALEAHQSMLERRRGGESGVSEVSVSVGAGIRGAEATMRAGRAVYPVERTLLTTGVLDRCMQLLAAGGGRMATPELSVAYAGGDWVFANHPKSRLQVPYE
ncbi:MAG TPA: hypothetical protein DC058_13420, partial [Planctomycetaceae bacterium]|nr:hypothetical protein [Planctomycetaceae bacterium]HBC62200.1 hypothetical protein [Planctomycetaceae bacterium]